MIKRVRAEPLFHRTGPLLVRDGDVLNGPSDRSPQNLSDLPHRWSFADQSVSALSWHARIGQQGCGDAGYVFRADQRNDSRILTPRQVDSTLLSNAPADESAHVFVIRRRLEMNSAYLRPVEDAIGQSMLQIAEAGNMR